MSFDQMAPSLEVAKGLQLGVAVLGFSLNEHPEIVEWHGDDQGFPIDHVDDGVVQRLSHIRGGEHDMGGIDDDIPFSARFTGDIDIT